MHIIMQIITQITARIVHTSICAVELIPKHSVSVPQRPSTQQFVLHNELEHALRIQVEEKEEHSSRSLQHRRIQSVG